MQIRQRPIGILGGTFDPVHYGHLRIALEALEALRLLPARRPPHRDTPGASPEQRLTLLRLAVSDQPGFVIDERELRRDGPSYMVDTLTSLRAEHPATPLCLLVGSDAFAELPRWSRWSRLFELAHLVVLSRPGDRPGPAPELRAEMDARRLAESKALNEQPAGGIWFQDVTPLAISATRIRQLLATGRSPRYLLPDPVHEYILSRGLYRVPSRD